MCHNSPEHKRAKTHVNARVLHAHKFRLPVATPAQQTEPATSGQAKPRAPRRQPHAFVLMTKAIVSWCKFTSCPEQKLQPELGQWSPKPDTCHIDTRNHRAITAALVWGLSPTL